MLLELIYVFIKNENILRSALEGKWDCPQKCNYLIHLLTRIYRAPAMCQALL